jgi:REP element-mobilizing transposase RayT
MNQFHLVVFTRFRQLAFRSRLEYQAMWSSLREGFVAPLACVLMPDHLHLAIEAVDLGVAVRSLRDRVQALARRFRRGALWEELKEPEAIPNAQHLLRTIRYIHLNPCRRGLVRDPLEWEWSTHLDVLGAVAPAWVDLRRIEGLMRFGRTPWRERFHAYVSGDPSVQVAGTPIRSPKWTKTLRALG